VTQCSLEGRHHRVAYVNRLARLAALLDLESIFGTDLPAHAGFRIAVAEAYQHLLASGARAAAAG
jgi:mannitol-1-phosphate/altronate dehydrogenase